MEPQQCPASLPASTADDLASAGVTTIVELVRRGDVSAVDITLANLTQIANQDDALNALVHVDVEQALWAARSIDRRRACGGELGPLSGVTFVVKDNIDVRGQVTSSASRASDDAVALRDAPVVARLRAAGAVMIGRANMDEFAMGASTRTSIFGPTRNPWDVTRSPGGSSGGSAVAVAAGLAAFSVGTDTGGSIREPASQCGIVGLAPSPRLVPRAGVVPFALELDRVGPLARTVSDIHILLGVMAGRRAPWRTAESLRVGLVVELCGRANHDCVRDRLAEAAERLRSTGVSVVEVSMPDAAQALAAYMAVSSASAVPHLDKFVRAGRAGKEVERRWQLGRELLGSDELAHAGTVQRRLCAQLQGVFDRCDVLLSPTMPTTAPTWDSLDDSSDLTDPLSAPYTDCWTVIANLTGTPALSVPGGHSRTDGMPIGVMLGGPPGSDADLLALAAHLEPSDEDRLR